MNGVDILWIRVDGFSLTATLCVVDLSSEDVVLNGGLVRFDGAVFDGGECHLRQGRVGV